MLSSLYRILTDVGAPFIGLYLRRRRAAGREDAGRFAERFGTPSLPRPAGRLVWCHAASVGESMSLRLMIEKLHDVYPDITILLTTGTVAAARMMATRLPDYAVHQYVPIDRVPCITTFLDHWKPTLTLWLESELWPNTLAILRQKKIPTVLLNARMSDKSFHNWQRVKGWAQELTSSFSLCLAQTEADGARFGTLGATQVKCLGNLKYATPPLSVDRDELASLKQQTQGRDLWLMSSTHSGEEGIAIAAHKVLAAKRPNLLTVIAPRHAVRGDEIAALLQSAGLRFARRSAGERIGADTQIYLADTMGELGLFYSLSPLAVLGGSFVPVGGHNPIEPAQLGAAVVFGPYMYNFSEISREFLSAQAAVALTQDYEIAATVDHLLTDSAARENLAQAARLLAEEKRHIIDKIIIEMEPWLRAQG